MHNWQRVALGIIAADQLTKILANYHLNQFTPKTIVPNFFDLSLTLIDPVAWQRWLVVVVSIAAVVIIIYAVKRLRPQQKTSRIALGIILGGGIGNFINYSLLGTGIDFISVKLGSNYYWPACNIADLAIMLGVALIVADGLYESSDRTQ